MRLSATQAGGLLLALSWSATVSHAAQLILVLRTGPNSWQIQEAEKITINAKGRLRLGTAGKPLLSVVDYKKLPGAPVLEAGVLRRHADGYLVRKEGDGWAPVAPDGLSLKASSSYTEIWSSATVAIQKDRDAKSVATLKTGEIFAVLPGGDRDEAVANFLCDERSFRGVGETDARAAFDERMSLLVAVAGSTKGAAGDRLKQLLLDDMEQADRRLSVGVAQYADLLAGLRTVEVSNKAFPNDPRQTAARMTLLEKKAWLDRRIAILEAFRAGELWDAFLDKYGEFERYDSAFPALRQLRDSAFRQSAEQHLAEGKRLYQAKQYLLALRELYLARKRNPASPEIRGLIETARIEEARSYSALVKRPPVDRTSSRALQLSRHLQFAENYVGDGRLKEAEEEVSAAEVLDRDSTQVLLARARLLQARKEPLQAIAMLDSYDRRVSTDEEIAAGEALRGRILYQLKTAKEGLKDAVTKAEAGGDYVQALSSAQAGLGLDSEDPDFLLHAGRNAAILRNVPRAEELLQQYLELSAPSGGDQKVRMAVYDSLGTMKAHLPEAQGSPNWFSGYKSPPAAFYCPISLAPNAHVASVEASRKQTTAFIWRGDTLKEVDTTSAQAGEQAVHIYFDYFKDGKAVRRASTQPFSDAGAELPVPRFTASGPVGTGAGVYVALLNHPAVDPIMIERLTGQRVATLIGGNPYFHPFVWEDVFPFLAEYDNQGRVVSARQLMKTGQTGAGRVLEFRWDGLLLVEIAEQGSGTYRRTMQYSGGRLTGETIVFRGKSAKIEYKYKGDRLVEADCSEDLSLDGRSRKVTFQ